MKNEFDLDFKYDGNDSFFNEKETLDIYDDSKDFEWSRKKSILLAAWGGKDNLLSMTLQPRKIEILGANNELFQRIKCSLDNSILSYSVIDNGSFNLFISIDKSSGDKISNALVLALKGDGKINI